MQEKFLLELPPFQKRYKGEDINSNESIRQVDYKCYQVVG